MASEVRQPKPIDVELCQLRESMSARGAGDISDEMLNTHMPKKTSLIEGPEKAGAPWPPSRAASVYGLNDPHPLRFPPHAI